MAGKGRKARQRAQQQAPTAGTLTVDRGRRAGHYQGRYFSAVYRDGKAYACTAWDDNAEEVGSPMDFDAWVGSFKGR